MKVPFLDLKVKDKNTKKSLLKFRKYFKSWKGIEEPELKLLKKKWLLAKNKICSWTFIWQQCTLLSFKSFRH